MDTIETTTFFDQRPSHPARPDWLIEAERNSASADKAMDELVDSRSQYASDQDYYDALQIAQLQADAAYQMMVDCRTAYLGGYVPVSVIAACPHTNSHIEDCEEKDYADNGAFFRMSWQALICDYCGCEIVPLNREAAASVAEIPF